MKNIEVFYQNLRHEDPIEEQILEAKRNGIIKSYFLTTLSAMNAKRNTDLCLWCDAVWSDHHRCAYAPDYNCRFSFGEDDDGIAFVKVTKKGLKLMEVQHSAEEELHPNAEGKFGDDLSVSNSSNSCILQEKEEVSHVDQVFDEIPVPSISLNQAQMVRETNPFISSKEATITSAHHMFDKIPEPISHLNQVPMLRANGDNTRNHLVAASSAVPCIKLAENEAPATLNLNAPNELSSADNMFDKLPVPAFILEMAQAAKTTQENKEMTYAHQLFDAMTEPTERTKGNQTMCQDAVINNENTPIEDDYFAHKQQLFARVDALDASYFHDLVVNANRERFAMLQNLMFQSCPPLVQTPTYYGEFSGSNSYLEYAYLQVTVKPFISFVEIETDVLYMGTMNINYDDLIWNMISEPICFSWFTFDPGVLLRCVSNSGFSTYSKFFGSKMVRTANLHYKEVHGWETLEVELDILTWMDSLLTTFQPSSFNFVNCLLSSALKYEIVRIIALNNHAHTDIVSIHLKTLNSCGSSSENLMIVHYMDLEPGVLSAIHHISRGLELLSYDITCSVLSYDLGDYRSTSRMTDRYKLFDPGILVSDSSVLFFSYTLEDKGEFRGEEDTNGKCTWILLKHLDIWSTYNASRANISFVLVSYVFDPGGFSFCVGQISMVVLDDWFMMLLLYLLKSDSTYFMLILALIPVLEDDDGYLSEYVAAYSLPYDIIMHNLEIIINQAANVHPHIIRFHLQFPTFYKLQMSRLLLGFSHLCFNIVCWKFSASCVAINWEFEEVLYMFEQHYSANMCILLDFSHKSVSIWRGKIICFDSVWVIRDLAQGVKDVLWSNTLEQIGSDRGDALRLAGNTSFLTEMTWMKNCATSSYEFLVEMTSSFFIFDPGGNGDSLRGKTWGIMSVSYEAAKAKTMLKWEADMLLENDKLTENDTIFVFDPGGLYLATCSYKPLEIINLQAKGCGYEANLILEDKDRFKGTVLIHIKNETKGSLVICPSCFLFPKVYSLYKGIIKL